MCRTVLWAPEDSGGSPALGRVWWWRLGTGVGPGVCLVGWVTGSAAPPVPPGLGVTRGVGDGSSDEGGRC